MSPLPRLSELPYWAKFSRSSSALMPVPWSVTVTQWTPGVLESSFSASVAALALLPTPEGTETSTGLSTPALTVASIAFEMASRIA